MRRIVLTAPLIALFLLGAAAPAAEARKPRTTCQCLPQPLGWRWDNSVAVFSGTVTKIETVTHWVQRGNDDIPVIVTFSIDEGFKGVEKGKTFLMHTNMQKYTCTGYAYEEGKSYLVFAYARREETYERWSQYDFPSDTYDVGGLCGGIKPLEGDEAAAEIEEIKSKPKGGTMLEDVDGVIGLPPEKPPSAH